MITMKTDYKKEIGKVKDMVSCVSTERIETIISGKTQVPIPHNNVFAYDQILISSTE